MKNSTRNELTIMASGEKCTPYGSLASDANGGWLLVGHGWHSRLTTLEAGVDELRDPTTRFLTGKKSVYEDGWLK